MIETPTVDTELVKSYLENHKTIASDQQAKQVVADETPFTTEPYILEPQQKPIDFSNNLKTTGNGIGTNFVEKETADQGSALIVVPSTEPTIFEPQIQDEKIATENETLPLDVKSSDVVEHKEKEDNCVIVDKQEESKRIQSEAAVEEDAEKTDEEDDPSKLPFDQESLASTKCVTPEVTLEQPQEVLPVSIKIQLEPFDKAGQDENETTVSTKNDVQIESNHVQEAQVAIKPSGDSSELSIKEPVVKPHAKAETSLIKPPSPERRRLSIHKQPLNRSSSSEILPKSEERKRRWGGSTGSNLNSSNVISSDALKGLIKPSQTKVEEVQTKLEPEKTVVNERTETESVSNDEIVESSAGKKAKVESEAVEGGDSKTVEEEVKQVRAKTPPKNPPSNVLLVSNLVRPFTLPKLKEILSKRGRLLTEKFWIDGIKSKCYAVYENEQIAVESREYIHGLKWPMSNPNTWLADFVALEELQQLLENEKEARDRAAEALVAPEPVVFSSPAKKEPAVRESPAKHAADQRNRKEDIKPSDEQSSVDSKVTPAQNPVSKIVYVRNLVRPFTLHQLKELLTKFGSIVEEKFWIDKIKSRCYAVYECEEVAEKSRNHFHGLKWPTGNPKTLISDFANETELDKCMLADRKVDEAKKRREEEMKLRATLLEERKRKLQEEETTKAAKVVPAEQEHNVRQEKNQAREKLTKNEDEEETPVKKQRQSSVSPVRHRDDRSRKGNCQMWLFLTYITHIMDI